MRRFARLAAAGCLATLVTAAQAFTPDQADRAAAIKEGNVSWYTSTPFPLVQNLADKFTADTGIKVTLLRSGGEAVLRRFLQEYQAGQAGADIITMSDAAAASGMTRRGIFVPFKPDGFDKVIEGAKDKDGHWIAQRVHLIGMPVRTDLVPEADRPKTWSDLKNPKYKGKMVMPDPSFTAIQLLVVGMLSQKLGWDFYKALRTNDTMIVQGHQQVYKTMQTGERSIGAEGSDPRSFNDGKDLPNQSGDLSDRRRVRDLLAGRDHQEREEPERGEAVRAVHAVAGGAEDDRRQRDPFVAGRYRGARGPAVAERGEVHSDRSRSHREEREGPEGAVQRYFPVEAPSFRGASEAREPGIHTPQQWLWIPGSRANARAPE